MRTKFIDNTKIMLNGQITLPKEIREVLGVSGGDRVTFIVMMLESQIPPFTL